MPRKIKAKQSIEITGNLKKKQLLPKYLFAIAEYVDDTKLKTMLEKTAKNINDLVVRDGLLHSQAIAKDFLAEYGYDYKDKTLVRQLSVIYVKLADFRVDTNKLKSRYDSFYKLALDISSQTNQLVREILTITKSLGIAPKDMLAEIADLSLVYNGFLGDLNKYPTWKSY